MSEIERLCYDLPYAEKVRLVQSLTASIHLHWVERKTNLCLAVEKVFGKTMTGSRKPEQVWMRAMVAYRLKQEGLRKADIGRLMDRSWADVHHLCGMMTDAIKLPNAYGDILELWNKFELQVQ